MAEETTVQEPVSQPQNSRREALALVVGLGGWLVPGLGHALLKMWGRAVICFLTVGVLVWVGAGMRGNLFTSRGNDAFDSLGYIADLGTGGFYWVARSLETNGPDVSLDQCRRCVSPSRQGGCDGRAIRRHHHRNGRRRRNAGVCPRADGQAHPAARARRLRAP